MLCICLNYPSGLRQFQSVSTWISKLFLTVSKWVDSELAKFGHHWEFKTLFSSLVALTERLQVHLTSFMKKSTHVVSGKTSKKHLLFTSGGVLEWIRVVSVIFRRSLGGQGTASHGSRSNESLRESLNGGLSKLSHLKQKRYDLKAINFLAKNKSAKCGNQKSIDFLTFFKVKNWLIWLLIRVEQVLEKCLIF